MEDRKERITKPFQNSLERLNNNLDIVQLHWSTAKYNPFQEMQLLTNLSDLIDCGYDFKIGLSNIGPNRLQKIINFLNSRGKQLATVQVQFSLLSPDLERQKLVKQICEKNNIHFLAYSPLSFGILCKDPASKNIYNTSIMRKLIFKIYEEPTFELRSLMKDIAVSRSVSIAQVAINWCCYQGAIPLVGLRKKEHVIDISGVFNWDLSEEEFKNLELTSKKCLKKMPANPFSSL